MQSFLAHLPLLKSYPTVSRSSSPTTFTERTLHTCDLYSTTPGSGEDHGPSTSPLTLPESRRRIVHRQTTPAFPSLRGASDQHSRHRPDDKDFFKSKSLGTLLVNHQLAISSLPEAKSFPALPSTSEDEKKVRFTPHVATESQREVKNDTNALQRDSQSDCKGQALLTFAQETSTPSRFTGESLALVPLSTPRVEVMLAESRPSTNADFGGIENEDWLPATASAADGEDILGVSALSGDYYSASAPPGGDSALSQFSNVLPDEFEEDSVTSLGRQSSQSPDSPKGDDEEPLARSSPAVNAVSLTRTQCYNNGLLSFQVFSPLSRSSVHDSLIESHERRSSIFSSPQYGSIVSAAQSTSLSFGISEQIDSVVSLTPLQSPADQVGQLVPLCTPRDSINLLLQRGADPNLCSIPLPPLFYTIRAGDPQAVERLLNSGANTEQCLPIEVHTVFG